TSYADDDVLVSLRYEVRSATDRDIVDACFSRSSDIDFHGCCVARVAECGSEDDTDAPEESIPVDTEVVARRQVDFLGRTSSLRYCDSSEGTGGTARGDSD